MKRSEQPWVPALLVAVALVLVLVFVFGRRDGDSKDGGGSNQPASEQAASEGGGGDRASGGETETPEAPKAEWPSELKWKPVILGDRDDGFDALSPEVPAGVYVWSDFQGWFVWVVDPAGKAAGRGTVSTNSEFGSAELVDGGTGEFVREDSVLRFDFTGIDGRASGFRFNQGFFTSEVTIELEGEDLPVFLGNDATPLAPPFVIDKVLPGS